MYRISRTDMLHGGAPQKRKGGGTGLQNPPPSHSSPVPGANPRSLLALISPLINRQSSGHRTQPQLRGSLLNFMLRVRLGRERKPNSRTALVDGPPSVRLSWRSWTGQGYWINGEGANLRQSASTTWWFRPLRFGHVTWRFKCGLWSERDRGYLELQNFRKCSNLSKLDSPPI